jgi:ABC-type antimicrobial peptide transport system permease subunit
VLVIAGTVLGLVAAYYLADLLAAVLFGVQPRDAAVFAGVPAILLLVAAAAVAIPALRAGQVSPLDALRYE